MHSNRATSIVLTLCPVHENSPIIKYMYMYMYVYVYSYVYLCSIHVYLN